MYLIDSVEIVIQTVGGVAATGLLQCLVGYAEKRRLNFSFSRHFARISSPLVSVFLEFLAYFCVSGSLLGRSLSDGRPVSFLVRLLRRIPAALFSRYSIETAPLSFFLVKMSLFSWLQHVVGALRAGVVDFRGQDQVYTLLLLLTAAGGFIGFFGGMLLHSFAFTVYVVLGAAAAACIFCIPSWPFYARHTVEWTPHDPARIEALFQQQQQQQLAREGSVAAADEAAKNKKKKAGGRKAKK